MYCFYDKEGVLSIIPEDHHDAMTNKWFLKEFAVHGARLLNVETETDGEGGQFNFGTKRQHTEAYGYLDQGGGQGGSYPRPEMRYDNTISNMRDYRVESERGRDNSRGERQGEGPRGTRDRDPNNGR